MTTTTSKTSDFYFACRNGDVNAVKTILATLKSNQIDRIEPNGSTALHGASFYGHTEIVRMLLERKANVTIRNKYDKTAKEEASNDEIRSVFESANQIEENNSDDDDMPPSSDRLEIYPNKQDVNKSALATRILRARLGTYTAHQYTLSAASILEHLESKYHKLHQAQGNQESPKMVEECFNEYRKTGDFNSMLRLYTLGTPFYAMINDDETFHIEMYKHLIHYEKYNFQGRLYRGMRLSSKDLEPYRWAFRNPKSLIEIRKPTLPSMNRRRADGFLKYKGNGQQTVLFQYDFAEKCFSAVVTKEFSEFPLEEEVLIIPGTFFEVTEMKGIDDGIIFISLKNIPVDKNTLPTNN